MMCAKTIFGKSFGDILAMVPEAGLRKKSLPTHTKKKNREQKRKFKENVEDA